MKSILHEFYYGNINPNEKPFKRDSEYSRVIKSLSDSEEKLLKLLIGTEKELFETFSKAHGDLNEISVADAFVDGFCLGMRIAIELWKSSIKQNSEKAEYIRLFLSLVQTVL